MICLRSQTRTARTTKRCRDCLTPIRHGDRYVDAAMADEGRAYSWPSHEPCAAEVARLCDHDGVEEGSLVNYFERADLSPEYLAWLDARRAP